jgi:hypothetical protein
MKTFTAIALLGAITSAEDVYRYSTRFWNSWAAKHKHERMVGELEADKAGL